MVSYARSLCEDVEFSAEDALRSDPEFLYEVYSVAVEVGTGIRVAMLLRGRTHAMFVCTRALVHKDACACVSFHALRFISCSLSHTLPNANAPDRRAPPP